MNGAEKKGVLSMGTASGLSIWKVLFRAPGSRAWTNKIATSERQALELADLLRAQGLEVGHVTRL